VLGAEVGVPGPSPSRGRRERQQQGHFSAPPGADATMASEQTTRSRQGAGCCRPWPRPGLGDAEVKLPLGTRPSADEKTSGADTGRRISNRTKSFPRRMNKARSEVPNTASDIPKGRESDCSLTGRRAIRTRGELGMAPKPSQRSISRRRRERQPGGGAAGKRREHDR
jgi:hypothetical protein